MPDTLAAAFAAVRVGCANPAFTIAVARATSVAKRRAIHARRPACAKALSARKRKASPAIAATRLRPDTRVPPHLCVTNRVISPLALYDIEFTSACQTTLQGGQLTLFWRTIEAHTPDTEWVMIINRGNMRLRTPTTAFFILLALLLTPLTTFAMLLLPAPIVLLFQSDRGRQAIWCLAIGLFALSLFLSPIAIFIYFVAIGLFAYFLSRGYATHTMRIHAVNATLVVVGVFIVGLALLRINGTSVTAYFSSVISRALASGAGVPHAAGAGLAAALLHDVTIALPAWIVIFSACVTVLNLAVTRWIIARSDTDSAPVLSVIRCQRYVPIALVLGLSGALFIPSSVPILSQLCINAFLIAMFLLILNAYSLLWWRVRPLPGARFLIICLLVLTLFPLFAGIYTVATVILAIATVIGAADALLDLRKRAKLPR